MMAGGGVIFARDLPDVPLDAAAEFYTLVPGIRDNFKTHPQLTLTIVFDPAGHEHHGRPERASASHTDATKCHRNAP